MICLTVPMCTQPIDWLSAFIQYDLREPRLRYLFFVLREPRIRYLFLVQMASELKPG